MPAHIYLLPTYANATHLEDHRGAKEHESSVAFTDHGMIIKLSEKNSLVEDKYSMNIHSGNFTLEGSNESREAMIHHHPKGHEEKHLQFKLHSENKVIRISLPLLDKEDYERCIKGFIYTAKRIIEYEKEEFKIYVDLIEYFFNERIEELCVDRVFLLEKIQQAYKEGNVRDDSNKVISTIELGEIKKDPHLLPFLEF
ncbi:MAG: hypothetical protein ABIH34_00740 [Nanoarchaeota archaeon]